MCANILLIILFFSMDSVDKILFIFYLNLNKCACKSHPERLCVIHCITAQPLSSVCQIVTFFTSVNFTLFVAVHISMTVYSVFNMET